MVTSPQYGKTIAAIAIDSPHFGEKWRTHFLELLCLNPEPQPPYQGHVLDLLQPAKQPTQSPPSSTGELGTHRNQIRPGRKRPGRGVQSAPQPPPFWWHARAQPTPGVLVKRWLRGLRGLEARCFLRAGLNMGPYGPIFWWSVSAGFVSS